jgi:hypothetical protein
MSHSCEKSSNPLHVEYAAHRAWYYGTKLNWAEEMYSRHGGYAEAEEMDWWSSRYHKARQDYDNLCRQLKEKRYE